MTESSRSADSYTGYEQALAQLAGRLDIKGDSYAEFLIYQQRLLENFDLSRRYGDTETRKAERAQIVSQLNQFAMSQLGITFNDLLYALGQQQNERQVPDIFTPFERGLTQLISRIGRDNPHFSDLLTFQQRLMENIDGARAYGDTETSGHERATIVDSLNLLAQAEQGVTFEDIMRTVPPAESTAAKTQPDDRDSERPNGSRSHEAAPATLPASAPAAYDFFVSYHTIDGEWVRGELLPALEQVGLKVSIDYRNFNSRRPILQEIERAVSQSRATIAIISPEYIESDIGQYTTLVAQSSDPAGLNQRFIPVVLRPTQLPARIAMLTAADLTRPDRRVAEIERLIRQLRDISARQPNTPDGSALPREKIAAEWMSNDRPEGKDQLGYDRYADAFAQVLQSRYTRPPLTIGLYASWGMGKSFLMRKIKEKMEVRIKQQRTARRARPFLIRLKDWLMRYLVVTRLIAPAVRKSGNPVEDVEDFLFIDFNAWIYSGSENLWAGLVTKLYSEIEKHFGQLRTAYFRLGQSFRSSFRKTLALLLVYGLLGAALSFLLNYTDIQGRFGDLSGALEALTKNWSNAPDAFKTLAGFAAIVGSALAALPPLLKSLNELYSSLISARSTIRTISSRPDFRDKIGFMADIKEEIGNISALVKRGKRGRPMRLVIFIDDLDRCPPSKAVEVLEAIMLLLADEDGAPFIIFLGLDARILVKAIEERYGKVLTDAGITGYEYLDKIVQIPFRIPPAPEPIVKHYINSLLRRDDEEGMVVAVAPPLADSSVQSAKDAEPTAAATLGVPVVLQQREGTVEGAEPTAAPPPPVEVSFTSAERQSFADFAPFLNSNPRRIKRIVNIYRIVRQIAKGISIEPARMIKWVILTEQWPYRTAWMMEHIENDYQQKVGRSTTSQTMLMDVFTLVEADVMAEKAQKLAFMDADPEIFKQFLEAVPQLCVEDVETLHPVTFNLNPAVKEEVYRAAAQKITPQMPKTATKKRQNPAKLPKKHQNPAKSPAKAPIVVPGMAAGNGQPPDAEPQTDSLHNANPAN